MKESELMKIHSKYIDDSLHTKFNLNNTIGPDNYVYCRINKGVYGLKQAVHLDYDDLVLHLAKYSYSPHKICPNIWSQKTKKKFCLCVDNFGVIFFNDSNKNYSIKALQDKYEITIDINGSSFCGLHSNWNYVHGYVEISMPNFVA